MRVYKNYNQEELDRQYNVRAGIPETQDIFERWRTTSASTRAQYASALTEDIKYGDAGQQAIDYFSVSMPGQPLIAFIHGGYWQSLDKAHFSYLAEAYIKVGLNFAAIDYRLAPSVTMDDIVEDCTQAVAFLARHAGDLGFDPKRLVLTGSSAGGHLVAQMVSTDWTAHDLPDSTIKAGCALSGLYDLEPIRLCYLNKVIGMDKDMARRNSPVHNVPRKAPPLVLSYGGAETSEFECQQTDYAQAWRSNGLACSILQQADGHHFDMVDRLGDSSAELFSAVCSLTKVE